MIRVNQSDFEEWLELPITKLYFKALKNQANERRYHAAYGSYRKENLFDTGEAYVRALTQAEVYEVASEPRWEDIEKSVEEKDMQIEL